MTGNNYNCKYRFVWMWKSVAVFWSLLQQELFCHGFSPYLSHKSFRGNDRSTLLYNSERKTSNESSSNRVPWEFLRFVKQSSKFVTFGNNRVKPSKAKDRKGRIAPGTILWTAGKENDFEFAPLDDVVMGGASFSTFDTATGKWRGSLTDANNGGFVGIRSTPQVDYDLSGCKGIQWTLKANKELRLKVVLRDSSEFNGIGWTTSRDTNESTTPSALKIPFQGKNALVPSRFAKILTDAPPFSTSTVKAFQLTYSKFEYDGGMNPKFDLGDFGLQLLEIRTY